MKWFGDDWGAPMCKDSPHVPTPIGARCAHCDEPIAVGESGVILNGFDSVEPLIPNPIPFHYECNLRNIVGSQGHQIRQCSCYGIEDTSELGLTPRQAAVKAKLWFEAAVRDKK